MTFAERWDRFWYGGEHLRVRMTTFRVVFFTLLAFDMWVLMLSSAPRYGVAGFNVSHLPFLDGALPLPNVAMASLAYLVGGFMALRVAFGIATRGSLYLLTALYGGIYFWSQADSYQHHYLIALLLVLCWFLPLEDLPQLERREPEERSSQLRSWAARLIYVEVSIVYFYTAVTKTNRYWLDGWALDRIITTSSMRDFLALWAETFGTSDLGPYAFTAHAIMIWQYFVAGAFLIPKLRPLACITGPLFHILVEVIDLKIGWFSYYMIGIYYILLFPNSWFLAIGRPIGRAMAPLQGAWEWIIRPRKAPPLGPLALAAGALTALFIMVGVPVAGRGIIALVLAGMVAWSLRGGLPERLWARAAVQVGSVLVMWLALSVSGVLYNYHRYAAGDFKRRGQLELAATHYEQANRASFGGSARYFQLGEVYERLGRYDEARRAYERGLRAAPNDARGTRGLQRLSRRSPKR